MQKLEKAQASCKARFFLFWRMHLEQSRTERTYFVLISMVVFSFAEPALR